MFLISSLIFYGIFRLKKTYTNVFHDIGFGEPVQQPIFEEGKTEFGLTYILNHWLCGLIDRACFYLMKPVALSDALLSWAVLA